MPRSGRPRPSRRPGLPALLVLLVLAAEPGGAAALPVTPSAEPAPSAASAPASGPVRTGVPAARAALRRLLPRHAGQFTLLPGPRSADGQDSFTVSGRAGAVVVRGSTPAFRLLVAEWQCDERLLAAVTGSDRNFLFGRWTADARSWGVNAAERDRYEYDVRSLLTTWGTRTTSEPPFALHDYANREWAGLLEEFYAPRWARYFASPDRALVSGEAPETIDWYAVEEAWARRTSSHPTEPSGDPYALARAVADALPPADART
ncbi:alpha-N-acetylglucosaminidase C-terminal domain-containing protein [Streptomyces sp. NPDC058304]|uniref:alpha-N-acetylglucosaminidase C-terminal domain-containing protein n=1 Tax=Streptomyces sp. NPDC058304 TaxID=3346437 RepID=UPI0036E4D1B2